MKVKYKNLKMFSCILQFNNKNVFGNKKKKSVFVFVYQFQGLQRVVVFTDERRIFKVLCDNEKVQHAQQEIILSLQNVGISLVNNSSSQEVSFIGITRCSACVSD